LPVLRPEIFWTHQSGVRARRQQWRRTRSRAVTTRNSGPGGPKRASDSMMRAYGVGRSVGDGSCRCLLIRGRAPAAWGRRLTSCGGCWLRARARGCVWPGADGWPRSWTYGRPARFSPDGCHTLNSWPRGISAGDAQAGGGPGSTGSRPSIVKRLTSRRGKIDPQAKPAVVDPVT